MRITSRLGRRMIAVLAAGAAAAGLVAASGLVMPAQATTSLGTLTITPATGNESNSLHGVTSASCPGGSTGIIGYMTGPGITEQNNGATQSILLSNHVVATDFDFSNIFKDVFAANSIAAPSGTFNVRIACIGADFFTEVGQFSQQVNFTPTGGTNAASYVTVIPTQPTTTTLATPTPADPVVSGSSVHLSATVDGGAAGTPTGQVQFKSGATNLGAPVALTAGAATLDTTALPAGTDSLTAVYVPGGGNALGTSTSSAVSYVVAGPTSITGTARVDGVISCGATTGGTKTYLWKKAGVSTGITSASVTVPASWLNASITCDLTSTKSATQVTRTSAAVKIALGATLVNRVRPKVLGIMHVGRRLTCSPGTWSPSATSYRYQWLRAGRPIAGKTARTYRTVRADKGKLISCKVTAVRAGHTSGVAKSPARKVT
jgi:hypothetical protein